MKTKGLEITKNIRQWMRWKYQTSGSHHQCYICLRSFRRFRPFRNGWKSVSKFTRELETIGSDVENFACPFCGCHDRERHLTMYFDRLGLWAKIKDQNLLHFAPEQHLSVRIKQQLPALYIKADLFPSSPEIEAVDVTQIPYKENEFDIVICNHVLEHVVDDNRALAELYRILKPGGFAVLQTPYTQLLGNSFCDPLINTDELRNRFYGQEDHVRLYGRDLFQRIQQAGFELELKTHADVLPDIDALLFGVNPRENLILALKNK